MSDALRVAVSGLQQAVARTTQAAGNIVNASSTGKNIDSDLVSIMVEKHNYAANVEVIKTAREMDKALLDIKV